MKEPVMWEEGATEMLTPAEWDEFQRLATRVGVAAERVSQLRRSDRDLVRHGSGESTILLAGRPCGGIELLLARWISPDATDAMTQASPEPVVISHRPELAQPTIGKWPVWKHAGAGENHLIFLLADGHPGSRIIGQLSSLENLRLLVLVTKLGQPLHPSDREFARVVSPFIPLVRVVAVAVPGEEPTADDVASFSQFAFSQMREAGFRDGRCLAAGVWFTEASARRSDTIQDLARFISSDRAAAATARVPMLKRQLCSVLRELREAASRVPACGPPVPVTDARMLADNFRKYLADLGRELSRVVNRGSVHDDAGLRSRFLDRVRSWGAYIEPEGMWLKHVETLRPGIQAALMRESEAIAPVLRYESFRDNSAAACHLAENHFESATRADSAVERLIDETKRVAFGFALGIVAFLIVNQLQLELARALAYVAMVLCMILGYAAARRLSRPAPVPTTTAYFPLRTNVSSTSPIVPDDWNSVETRMLAWFNSYFVAREASLLDECRRFAERLKCEEN